MSTAQVLVLALLIGIVSGLRAATAPAVVAWAAYKHSLDLHDSLLGFMGSKAAVGVFTVLALAELMADKLPSTPSRTALGGLVPRIAFGGLSGAAIAAGGSQSILLGALLGAAGAVVGAFGGYQFRTRLVRALGVPDFVVAVFEDAIAIGGGVLIVCAVR